LYVGGISQIISDIWHISFGGGIPVRFPTGLDNKKYANDFGGKKAPLVS
jgi:hypothetical protein